MIPEKLTLQGIYSYQDEPQTIEFDPLLGAGLFGIFGAVGSGKSSILEAISLAVYGEIERLNRRDDRNYNMMNLKSDRLYIDYVFRTYDQKIYRFECEGKRNSRRYNEVNTYRRKASMWKENKWVALDHADGEVITGMSYDNFKRTVIIPQGKFKEFLELTPGGRSQMLQELFSLGRFDLAASNTKLTAQNSDEIQRIEGHLSAYDDVSLKSLEALRQELKHLSEQLEKQVMKFDQIKKETENSKVLKQLHNRKKEHQKAFQKLKEKKPDIRKAEHLLKKYQEARNEFANRITQKQELEDSVEVMEKTIGDMSRKEARLRTSKEEIAQKYERLRLAKESHVIQKRKGEEAAIASKLLSIRQNYETKKQRVVKGESLVRKVEKKIKESRDELEKLKEQLAHDRGKVRDRELLLELRNAFIRQKELSERIQNRKKQRVQALQTIKQKKIHFQKKYKLSEPLKNESDVVIELKKRLERLKSRIKDTRNKMHHFRIQAEMAHHVTQLVRGEPCPLCGSTDHPVPADIDMDAGIIDETGRLIENLEVDQRKIEKAIHEWRSLIKEEEDVKENQIQERKDITQLEKELDGVQELLNNYKEQYPESSFVEQSLKSSGQVIKVIHSNERKEAEINQDLRQELSDLEKYTDKIGHLRSEIDQFKGEVKTLEESLGKDTKSYLNDYSADEWMRKSQKLEEKIKKENEEFNEIAHKHEKVVQEHNELRTSVKERSGFLNNEKEKLIKASNELDRALEVSEFESIKEVKAVLEQAPDVDKVQEQIRKYDREFHALYQVLKELDEQIGDQAFDEEEHKKIVATYAETEKKLTELRDQKNYLVRKRKDFQEKWNKKEELKKTHDSLQERAENLKVLEGLFRGKGFVDYISTVYLREICEIANRRFRKLTNNHFELVLGDQNQFEVRDYLHDGRIRSIKTLSGGQTFQASLCLALALAESLQNRHQSQQNFFFLDEGFGTLDGDALQMVMESLKSLRQEGRIVGVISHVESLQTEIDMYLHIRNDAEKGSRIQKSWQG